MHDAEPTKPIEKLDPTKNTSPTQKDVHQLRKEFYRLNSTAGDQHSNPEFTSTESKDLDKHTGVGKVVGEIYSDINDITSIYKSHKLPDKTIWKMLDNVLQKRLQGTNEQESEALQLFASDVRAVTEKVRQLDQLLLNKSADKRIDRIQDLLQDLDNPKYDPFTTRSIEKNLSESDPIPSKRMQDDWIQLASTDADPITGRSRPKSLE